MVVVRKILQLVVIILWAFIVCVPTFSQCANKISSLLSSRSVVET
jgi:hypothetical protein